MTRNKSTKSEFLPALSIPNNEHKHTQEHTHRNTHTHTQKHTQEHTHTHLDREVHTYKGWNEFGPRQQSFAPAPWDPHGPVGWGHPVSTEASAHTWLWYNLSLLSHQAVSMP